MPSFESSALAEWTGGHWHADVRPEPVEGFAFDARMVNAGECFIALRGGVRDGHEFCAQAVSGGAIALIVERVQALEIPQLVVADTLLAMGAIAKARRRAFDGTVVGVTGSCGKTSTKEMLRLILGASKTHATAGNWNNRIGVPMTLFGLDRSFQDCAVIEAGINQPGEMALLGEMIEPDLTVVTMIGAAHLELLKSLDGVALEKSALVAASKVDGPLVTTHAVMAYRAYQRFADRAIVLVPIGVQFDLPVARVVRYALESVEGTQTRLNLRYADTEVAYMIASASEGICVNAALAITVGASLGIDSSCLRERIAAWRPTGNRGRVVALGAQSFYVDCYNANPDSMRDALTTFRESAGDAPRCYILGGMNELGEAAVELHFKVGTQLDLRAQDVVYFVGPRIFSEAYMKGALKAGASFGQLHRVKTCNEIKSYLAEFTGSIFLKGSRSYALETLLPDGL